MKILLNMLASLLLPSLPLLAQTDLNMLLAKAEERYPGIALKRAQADAARTDISLEKNKGLPVMDAGYQLNYATYNNLTGMSYPATLIPISGPPSAGNTYDPVPGTAVSLTAKWSPITFGQRKALIEHNRKIYEKQLAEVDNELLRVQFEVAFRYLDIAASKQLIQVYQKNIERNTFNLGQVRTLVRSGIRPGVDSLKFAGELSKAKTMLYKLENLMEGQQLELAEFLVEPELQDVSIDSIFTELLPRVSAPVDSTKHPLSRMAQSEVEAEEASLRRIERSWLPKLEFWGTAYGRGSGVDFQGNINRSDGFSPSRYNYGAGLQVIFPLLDWSNLSLRKKKQEALLSSSRDFAEQTRIGLNRQVEAARTNMSALLKIAAEIPAEYRANESAYRALQTRYRTGLIDYAELIQAQYDLLHAESRLKNAHIDCWKALLQLCMAKGDINIFLEQIQ